MAPELTPGDEKTRGEIGGVKLFTKVETNRVPQHVLIS